MKRKEVKVALSPNEEARLVREERERRRILRIQQVREQQRNIAQSVRQKVEQRRQQELEVLAEELRAQWEQQQKERVEHLQRLYQESLSLLGQGHRNAQEHEPDHSAADLKAQSDCKAEERYRRALKELKRQRLKNQENESRCIDARRKALETERIRSAKVASLPLPAQPLQEAASKPQHVVRKCDAASFAATHYHMPETMVDKETLSSQPSASVEAEQEVQRMVLMQRQAAQRREEQQEMARLRGKEALKKEQLIQDRGRLLLELEHLQQTDLLRRRQQLRDMPRQIFEPLYRRQETQLDLQRDMEFAFEDMYGGERRMKGDLLCHLVPEPLPPPSTDDLCQDLDVTQDDLTTSDPHQAEQDSQTPSDPPRAEREGSTPESAEDSQPLKASDEDKAAPRRGLKRLLTRIQTQRRCWSETEGVSSDSPCGRDSSIDTGSITAVEKQYKAEVEHSAAVAEKAQELEEQRRKEEELEKEKREQMEILEQLEQQRLKLEEKLSEAQRERALLKTSSTPTEPTDSTDSTPQPSAGTHSRTMEEHRRRLLQQKEIHRRSVEVARQRLEEYQRALRIQYNMTTAPPSTVPPAAVRSTPFRPTAVPPPTVPLTALHRPTGPPIVEPPTAVHPTAVPPTAVHPPTGPPTAFYPTAVLPTPVPSTAVPPPSILPTAVPLTAFRPVAVPLPTVLPTPVPLTAVCPTVFPPTAVPPPTVPPTAVRPDCVPPRAVPPTSFLPTALPLSGVTHSAGPHLHAGRPRTEAQTLAPTETTSRAMGPRAPPPSAPASDSLTVLRHRAFLKVLQDRLGVTESVPQKDVPHLSRPPDPPVSMATDPSVLSLSPSPVSSRMSSCPGVSAAPGPDQVVSSRSGSNTLSPVAGPSPVVTMTTAPSPAISTARDTGHVQVPRTAAGPGFVSVGAGSDSVLFGEDAPDRFIPTAVQPDSVVSVATDAGPLVSTRPGPPVSRGVGVGRDWEVPGLSGVDRDGVELRDKQEMDFPEPDEQPPRAKEQEQLRSNLLQALLRALDRSSVETSQCEDSEQRSTSSSRSSSGGSSVVSVPPSAAQKPPVSRARLGSVDTALHQLSVIEEVSTPASVSLLTGEDAVTREELQGSKRADSSASPSCSLSDFAQYMDSPQSLDFGSGGADYSGSSAVSSSKRPTEPSHRPEPSLSSSLSTGSYITTDPELHSQPDSERALVESPGSSLAQRSSQNQEGVLAEGTAPQTPKLVSVRTAEAAPTEEPSLLEMEDSFRPLVGQLSDQSMCPGAEDVTLGPDEVTPGMELLVGHPSAHSSVIGQMPGSSPLVAWDSSVREGLSFVPSGTWQNTGQECLPTERPENESSADVSNSSGFQQLLAEVTLNQKEAINPPDPPGPAELWSPEQMRPEEPSDCAGLSPWSPPESLLFPSLKGPCEEKGILEQSQITLASLTDSSSDEQDPEEEAGPQCLQTCPAEVTTENKRGTGRHSLEDPEKNMLPLLRPEPPESPGVPPESSAEAVGHREATLD